MHDVTITVSGPPISGKSTLAAIIGIALTEEGLNTNFFNEPGRRVEFTPRLVAEVHATKAARVSALKDKINIYIKEEQNDKYHSPGQ